MEHPQSKPFYLSDGVVIIAFILAIVIPNVLMILLGLFGPSPYLLDRSQFGHYENKARIHQEAKVELQVLESPTAARDLAKRYVSGKEKSSYTKTLDEHRYVRGDNGNYELVIPVEEALVRVEGRDREHVDAIFQGLPFVVENPEKNLLWILFKEHLGWFFAGLFGYVLACMLVFSRWHSAANTVRPARTVVPVSEPTLRRTLKELDNLGLPFEVREGGKGRLVARWRIADAEWREVLSKGGLKVSHEVTMALDPEKSIIRAVQTTRKLRTSAGLFGVLGSFSWSRSVGYGYESASSYGILKTEQGWRPAEAYRYRYVPSEITQPLANAILESGWTFKPVYTLFRALGS